MLQRLTTFLKEVRIELRKVTWPTRKETVHYTLTIIIISAAVALFLGGADYILQFILNKFIL